jgi:hypothetical protein
LKISALLFVGGPTHKLNVCTDLLEIQ